MDTLNCVCIEDMSLEDMVEVEGGFIPLVLVVALKLYALYG